MRVAPGSHSALVEGALSPRRTTAHFVGLVLLLLPIRIVYGVVLLTFFDVDPRAEFYDEIARNLLAGFGYTEDPAAGPNLWRTPLYPLFLAGLYALFGDSDLPAVAFQVLFDALTAGIAFGVAHRLFGIRVALFSAVAVAFYPVSAYYTVRMFSESMFTLILATIVLGLLVACRSGALRDFAILGLLLGLGLLCKPVLQLFPLVILASVVLSDMGTRRILINFSVMLVVAVLVVLPWSIRNYYATGHVIPLAVGIGKNLWLSNHLPTGGLDDDQLDPERRQLLKETLVRIAGPGTRVLTPDRDRVLFRKAVEEMLQAPAAWVQLQVSKFLRFWFSAFHPEKRPFDPLLIAIQLPLLILAGLGLWASRERWRTVVALPLVIAYFALVNTIVTVTTVRYAVPIMPYVIILAARGGEYLVTIFRRPTRS